MYQGRDYAEMVSKLSGFRDKRVGVLGEIMLDETDYGSVRGKSPENPNVDVITVERTINSLGGAGNTAANLKALGAKTFLFGRIGEDHSGKIVTSELSMKGINSHIIRAGETIVKNKAYTQHEGIWIQSNVRKDYGDRPDPLSSDMEDKLLGYINRTPFDVFVLSDYNKDIFKGDLGQRVIDYLNERNVSIIVDPKPANISRLQGATLIRPNLAEAALITGFDEDSQEYIAVELRRRSDAKSVAVTCGADGVFGYNGKFVKIAGIKVENPDTVGAGDTFASALALSTASGMDFYDSLYVANVAAGVVVGKTGTATCSLDELIERIKREG